eukprot:1159827-Pelagomonas_calceolata.AAC.16
MVYCAWCSEVESLLLLNSIQCHELPALRSDGSCSGRCCEVWGAFAVADPVSVQFPHLNEVEMGQGTYD